MVKRDCVEVRIFETVCVLGITWAGDKASHNNHRRTLKLGGKASTETWFSATAENEFAKTTQEMEVKLREAQYDPAI